MCNITQIALIWRHSLTEIICECRLNHRSYNGFYWKLEHGQDQSIRHPRDPPIGNGEVREAGECGTIGQSCLENGSEKLNQRKALTGRFQERFLVPRSSPRSAPRSAPCSVTLSLPETQILQFFYINSYIYLSTYITASTVLRSS